MSRKNFSQMPKHNRHADLPKRHNGYITDIPRFTFYNIEKKSRWRVLPAFCTILDSEAKKTQIKQESHFAK